jgi:hypothetical protein
MNGEPDDAAEALGLARQLRELIGEILERLTDAVKYGRRTRLMAWGLLASVILDVGLSAVTVAVIVHQVHASRQQQQTSRQLAATIRAVHLSQLRACAIGNSGRAGQIRLWDHLLATSPPPQGETAAERAQRQETITAFRLYVHRQFAPVRCKALYRQ